MAPTKRAAPKDPSAVTPRKRAAAAVPKKRGCRVGAHVDAEPGRGPCPGCGARRCVQTVKPTGRRCRKDPLHRRSQCQKHGGTAPQTRARAEREAAEEATAKAQARAVQLLGVPAAVDHREAAVAELGARYAAVLWFRQEIGSLPSLAVISERGESAHVLLGLHDKAQKRLNEILRLCHDMRIDQQMMDLARAHADQTDRIIHALLRGLGQDPQDPEVRQVVRAALTMVDGGLAS